MYKVISVSKIVNDEYQNALLCLIETGNGITIELVSGPQVQGFLKKAISYYHLCFTIDNIAHEIDRLLKEGAILLSDPKPAILFDGRKVAFLYTTEGIIELLEERHSEGVAS